MSLPAKIFISYAHEDIEYCRVLVKHLAPLKHRGLVKEWTDRRIQGGADYEAVIANELDTADLVILLLSPDFVDSRYCWEIELPRALRRHTTGEATVLPVFVRQCHLTDTPIARLQGVPREGRYVSSAPDKDEVWVEITRAIEEIIKSRGGSSVHDGSVDEGLPVDPPLAVGSILDGGRYRLEEMIGEGVIGTVWRAWDLREDKAIAIKALRQPWCTVDSEPAQMFFRGARRMSRLRHEAVVEVFRERIIHDGRYFYTMEYLAGGNLHQAVLSKRLSTPQALGAILKVGEALAYAHHSRLVHLDVKPQNIVLGSDDAPHLTDFDLMMPADSRGEGRRLMGTACYRAPELALDPPELGIAADIFGLAMTAVFCLHGADLDPNLVKDIPGFVGRLSAASELKTVLARALRESPQDRFPSMADFLSALRSATDCHPPDPPVRTPPPKPPPKADPVQATREAPMSQREQKRFAHGDIVDKKYEIDRFLGEGIIGASYLAKHFQSGRELVIKFIKPHLVSSTREEERAQVLFERASAIRHELLTRYGVLGRHDDLLYFTEEYFQSESLRQVINAYISERQQFTLQEACFIVTSILEAVEACHKKGIVHVNIKPENVLVNTRRVGPDGNIRLVRTVKVSGHGLSGLVRVFDEGFVNRTDFPYLAPELSGFQQEGAVQADIFSVGVILYELLCGQRPMGTYLAPTQLRDDLPDHVDDIVEIAIAHSPEDRYPTVRDMINDIQRSFSPEPKRQKIVHGPLIAIAAAASILVGLGTWGIVSHWPGSGAPQADERRALFEAYTAQAAGAPPTAALHPEMVWIPAGRFLHGRLAEEPLDVVQGNEPLGTAVDVASFLVDRHEVVPSGESGFTWPAAAKACEAQGKRLCAALEWEKACKGPQNSIYSYGDTFQEAAATTVSDGKGSTPWRSGYGVEDMSAGVAEWTSDTVTGSMGRRLVKGGQRGNPGKGTRCAFGIDEGEGYQSPLLGYRCCMDVGRD